MIIYRNFKRKKYDPERHTLETIPNDGVVMILNSTILSDLVKYHFAYYILDTTKPYGKVAASKILFTKLDLVIKKDAHFVIAKNINLALALINQFDFKFTSDDVVINFMNLEFIAAQEKIKEVEELNKIDEETMLASEIKPVKAIYEQHKL